ncbi:hypothetical protein T210_0130935 [Burkholderia pseudomallei MSHR6137]|nr:hypothetical protein T210_0130935 [Burkholderia pseudomallei MSHR6137]
MYASPAGSSGSQCVFRAGRNSPPAVGRHVAGEPASARAIARGVSRSGPMPEPTVIVRMKEDVQTVMCAQPRPRRARLRPRGAEAASRCLFAEP